MKNLIFKWIHVIPVFLCFAILIIVLMVPARVFSSQFFILCAHKMIYLLSKFFLNIFEVKVSIHELFPNNKKTYMIMSNHVSWFDIFILGYVFKGAPVTAVSKRENFFIPIFGQAIWMLFVVGVKRNKKDPDGDRKQIQKVAKVCRKNKLNLLFFPEGTRTTNGELQPFKKGGFEIAIDSGMEIIPLVMKGLYEVNNKNTSFWTVNPGVVEVFIERLKIRTEDYSSKGPLALKDETQLVMKKVLSG